MSNIFYLKCEVAYHSLNYVRDRLNLIRYFMDENSGVSRTRLSGITKRMNIVFETYEFIVEGYDRVESVTEYMKSELGDTTWIKDIVDLTEEYGITEDDVNDEDIDFWSVLDDKEI